MEQRPSPLVLAVLLVGFMLSLALYAGLERIGNGLDVFRAKTFAYDAPDPNQSVTPLPGNRLAITSDRQISIYRVQDDGALIFESAALIGAEPFKNTGNPPQPTPTPTPTPSPTPSVVPTPVSPFGTSNP